MNKTRTRPVIEQGTPENAVLEVLRLVTKTPPSSIVADFLQRFAADYFRWWFNSPDASAEEVLQLLRSRIPPKDLSPETEEHLGLIAQLLGAEIDSEPAPTPPQPEVKPQKVRVAATKAKPLKQNPPQQSPDAADDREGGFKFF